MTVSPDARTPSASVHALSGSTPPGAGAVVQPFGIATDTVVEMPDTFVPLGAVASDVVAVLAARRTVMAHPDAEVIDLAERVRALALRENRLWERTSDIEDAASAAMMPRPTRAEAALRCTIERATRDDGATVTAVVEPAGWAAENAARAAEHEAAEAAWKRGLAEEEARRGLPFWEKLRDRATARLARWGLRLASLEPATSAGVAAKAAASTAVTENGSLLEPWRRQLASSLSRDALRLIGVQAEAQYCVDQEQDGELFSLIERYGPLFQRYADSVVMEPAVERALSEIEDAIEVFMPRTIAGLSAKAAWVLEHDPEAETSTPKAFIRQVAAFANPEKSLRSAAADPFTAYHTEITRLQAIIKATDEETPEHDRAWGRWKAIDDLALTSRPATLAGAVGALEYARREHHQFSVEDRPAIDTTDKLILHLIDGALDVLRPMLEQGAPSLFNARPAPLSPVEFPRGRYPADVSREVIETYRTFLTMEMRFLDHEIYGRHEGRLHLWLDNPAGQMHGGREPAPSTRAATVLSLLGLMPMEGVHGAAQAAASAA